MTQLALIHDKQVVRYGATVEVLRSYLKSLARSRMDGVVDSDDAANYLDEHGITADKRLIGAVLKAPHFVQCGYGRSTRRRGMHALWKVA